MIDREKHDTAVIVSGLPRSGTSMLMSMLAAGGIPALTDRKRPADRHNPNGYFEHAGATRLTHNPDWIREAAGNAVKVISFQLYHLPDNVRCDILFIERSLAEMLASQRAMLDAPAPLDDREDRRMAALYEAHLDHVRRWLASRPNFRTLYLEHRRVLDDPAAAAEVIAHFLERPLDTQAMAARVDGNLYRQRR